MVRTFFLLTLCAGYFLSEVQAQTRAIEGVVRDAESRLGLPGASITLERGEAVVAGVAADTTGYYTLVAPASGVYQLTARFVGYLTMSVTITVSDEGVRQDFFLEPTEVGLEEIEVSTGPFQPPSDVAVATTRVTARTIRTLAGTGEDVLQALRVFPGVQTSGDYSTQLYIRGGTPDQNLILIDDIEVFSPYQLSGMGSLLNPELVRDVKLYAGTMPAEFGDRLSSALVVNTREGRTDGVLHGNVSTTLMTVNGTLEGKTGFWDGSWIASGRKTYFGSFANTFAQRVGIFNDIAFPNFVDGHFKLTLRPRRGHYIRTTVLTSHDRLDWVVDQDGVGYQGDTDNLYRGGKDLSHTAVGIQWHYVPTEATTVRWYVNWYRNQGGSSLGGGLQAWMAGLKTIDSPFDPPDPVFPSDQEAYFVQEEEYVVQKYSSGLRLAHTRGAHSIEAGVGVDQLTSDLTLDFQANEYARTLFDAIQLADPLVISVRDNAQVFRRRFRAHGYLQDRITLFDGALYVQPAVRLDYYGQIGRGYVTPRLSASVPLGGRTTLRLAGGRYIQSPGLEKTLDPDDNYNTARFESLAGLVPEEAWHAGISLSRRISRRWHTRFQGYHKWFESLLARKVAVQSIAVPRYFPAGSPIEGRVGFLTPSAWVIDYLDRPVLLPDLVNAGEGKSYGAELVVARERLQRSDRISGWLSYAVAHATRTANYGAGLVSYPFAYDRRHTLNLVLQWQISSSLSAGLTWRFGTGFPYTPAVYMTPLVALVEDPTEPGVMQEVVLADPETGYARMVPDFGGPENVYSARLTDYHRLDIRLTYELQWHAVTLRVYGDLINAYNRKNTITHKYFVGTDAKDNEHLPQALRPPPTVTLYREPIYGFPFIPSVGVRCMF